MKITICGSILDLSPSSVLQRNYMFLLAKLAPIRIFCAKHCQEIWALRRIASTFNYVVSASLLFFRFPAPMVLLVIWVTGFVVVFMFPFALACCRVKRHALANDNRIKNLIIRSGVKLRYFLSSKNSLPSAFTSSFGLGATVVIGPVISAFPRDQLEAVFAHELGHQAANDTLSGTVIGLTLVIAIAWFNEYIVSALNGGWVSCIGIALMSTIILLPLLCVVSRFIEYRADNYAARLTGDPLSMCKALESIRTVLENQLGCNLGKPLFWVKYYQMHPNIYQRIDRLMSLSLERPKL